MIPVSGIGSGAAQDLTAAEKVLGTPKVQRPAEKEKGPLKPAMDEYVPEEKQEPSGRYWLGKDEDGQPKIFFDDPERKPDASGEKEPEAPERKEPRQGQGAQGPKRKDGKKEEKCVANTDKVDREIKELKRKKEDLEQRINTEQDERRIEELERQLAQVERELDKKDNDTYRKQHTTFTQM